MTRFAIRQGGPPGSPKGWIVCRSEGSADYTTISTHEREEDAHRALAKLQSEAKQKKQHEKE